MTLSLDHRQRLNLILVLGEYDVQGRELHAVWHLLDSLDLDAAEKETVELREQTINGQIARWWNDSKSIPLKSFDLSEADVDRLRKAIDEFPRFKGSRDRGWLEPLQAQLTNASNNDISGKFS